MFFIISTIMLIFDQISKIIIRKNFNLHEESSIIKGVFSIAYVQNKGAAFGIFQNMQYMFIAFSLIVCGVIIYYIVKNKDTSIGLKIILALIFSGAIGNSIDRFFLGYVTDFIYFKIINFPVFNLADMYIVCGSILFSIYVLKKDA